MDDAAEKRDLFLKKFNEASARLIRFNELYKPGFLNKVKRVLLVPSFYLPYSLWKLGVGRPNQKKVRLFWGKEVLMDFDDYEVFMLDHFGTLNGTSELPLIRFFIKTLKSSDVFYDIGANYGLFFYLASEFCAEVHAFEPNPKIIPSLKRNAGNNFVNAVALSDRIGSTALYLSDGGTGMSTINTETLEVEFDYRFNEGKIIVPTTTIAEYVNHHLKPTVIKMDVEGAERAVINGGWDFFRDNSPIIAMEVWSGYEKAVEISSKAVERLKELGYKQYAIDENGDVVELTGANKNSGCNFIFKK